MSNILVTGAAGFLGSHVVDACIAAGHKVWALRRPTTDLWRLRNVSKNIRFVGLENLPTEIGKINAILHLATNYKKQDHPDDIAAMVADNITFPLQLLELALRNHVKAFINTGTFFEYDCTSVPITERAPVKPYNLYANTKIAFESFLRHRSQGRMTSTTLSLFSPYGPRDSSDKVIPTIVQKALRNEPIQLSDGMQKLDFTFATDIAQAYVAALRTALTSSDLQHSKYNIGTGFCHSIREIVSVMEQTLGRSIVKNWGSPSLSDIPIAYADITLAKHHLGWEPETNLHQGLQATIAYYRENSAQ